MRTIYTAQKLYNEKHPELGFGDVNALGKGGFIDQVLAQGEKQGYLFKVTIYKPKADPNDASDAAKTISKNSKESPSILWSVTAVPSLPGETGHRYFYTDSTGLIRVSTEGPANKASPELNATTSS